MHNNKNKLLAIERLGPGVGPTTSQFTNSNTNKGDWRNGTLWQYYDKDKKVKVKFTLGDVVEHLEQQQIVVMNTLELSQQVKFKKSPAAGRVARANLDYPIIVVKSEGQCRFILDGNHRFKKAMDDQEVEGIKTKILDLDDPKTPETFKKIFEDDIRVIRTKFRDPPT